MELQVGVKAFLKNNSGKYLLLRRSAEKYPEVGAKWDIPGGRIDPGTSLPDNLRREIKEEVGLELHETPKLIAAQDIIKSPERHVVRLTYLTMIIGQPTLSDEHSEFGWFTIDEMKKLEGIDHYMKEILEKEIF